MDEELVRQMVSEIITEVGSQHAQGGDDRILAIILVLLVIAMLVERILVARRQATESKSEAVAAAKREDAAIAREQANREQMERLLTAQAGLVRDTASSTADALQKVAVGQEDIARALREQSEHFQELHQKVDRLPDAIAQRLRETG